MDLISVILPTFRRFDGFKKVIDNFRIQIYKNFELIAIDDGSEEEIFSAKKIYLDSINDPRFILMKNEKNMKTTFTLNKGIQLSKGSYITWISDDNIYYPNYLSTLYVPGYDFIYSYWDQQYIPERIIYQKVVKNYYRNIYDILTKFWGCASFMWKKEFMSKIGNYDESIYGCNDYEYLLRTFLITNNILFIRTSTMKYIHHDDAVYYKNYEIINANKNEVINIYWNILKMKNKKGIRIIDFNEGFKLDELEKLELNSSQYNFIFIDKGLINLYNEEYQVMIISNKYKNLINNLILSEYLK